MVRADGGWLTHFIAVVRWVAIDSLCGTVCGVCPRRSAAAARDTSMAAKSSSTRVMAFLGVAGVRFGTTRSAMSRGIATLQ